MRTTLRRLKQGRVIEHTLPQEDTIAVQDPPKSRPRLPCCGPCRLPSVESGAPNRICDKDHGSLSMTGWLAMKPHPSVHPQPGKGGVYRMYSGCRNLKTSVLVLPWGTRNPSFLYANHQPVEASGTRWSHTLVCRRLRPDVANDLAAEPGPASNRCFEFDADRPPDACSSEGRPGGMWSLPGVSKHFQAGFRLRCSRE